MFTYKFFYLRRSADSDQIGRAGERFVTDIDQFLFQGFDPGYLFQSHIAVTDVKQHHYRKEKDPFPLFDEKIFRNELKLG